MQKLAKEMLWGLEQYAARREAFRNEVIAHKTNRRVALGPHATLLFEDFLTMKYQVQEMLRAERLFEPDEIEQEIEAYNPLIPDGRNWKATFLLEWDDANERRVHLAALRGIEHRIWIQINGCERLFAHANDDLERSNDDKTAAVHFLRFELSESMVQALKQNATLAMGIDHPGLPYKVAAVPDHIRKALIADLD